jgi:hypothetical protein
MSRINTSTGLLTGERFDPNPHYRRSRARTPSNATYPPNLSPVTAGEQASHTAAVAVVRHILGGVITEETDT